MYSEPHSPKSDQHGEEQQRWQDRLLCTWSGEPGSVLEESCDRIVIKLLEGQTVCFIGLYDLCVQRGAVEVCRATLYEGAKPQTIYAPSTHALPIIRCISSAVISLVSVPSAAKRMGLLQQFSPLFRRIWNDWPDQHAYPDDELKRRTFSWVCLLPLRILYSSTWTLNRYRSLTLLMILCKGLYVRWRSRLNSTFTWRTNAMRPISGTLLQWLGRDRLESPPSARR